MTGSVLVVGDVIDDIVARITVPIRRDTDTPATIARSSGGSAANTAVWLGHEGVAVEFVGHVGHGDAARFVEEFSAAGVHAYLEEDASEPTGTIVIIAEGESRTMLSDRGANVALNLAAIRDDLLEEVDWVHFTGYSIFHHRDPASVSQFLRRAQSKGASLMVDASSVGFLSDFGVGRFLEIIAGIDILRCNEEEALVLSGKDTLEDALVTLHHLFPAVVATQGGQGSSLIYAGEHHHVPPTHVEMVVDPTGAGDSFNAGLLAGLIAGHSIVEAAGRASAMAATCVTLMGARP
jgi:sugar/nucleoside kinase (ribokinase family)